MDGEDENDDGEDGKEDEKDDHLPNPKDGLGDPLDNSQTGHDKASLWIPSNCWVQIT